MRDAKTFILEPDEYKTAFKLRTLPTGQFIPAKGIFITKDGQNTWVSTAHNVDDGCRIKLIWNGKGHGKIKHLSSTPRRKYYMALMWFSLILWALSWVFVVFEVTNGNYAARGLRTDHVLLTATTAWMGLDIVVLRNGHDFKKWFVTIFSYMVMFASVASFIIYLVNLIGGIG